MNDQKEANKDRQSLFLTNLKTTADKQKRSSDSADVVSLNSVKADIKEPHFQSPRGDAKGDKSPSKD